MSRAFVLLILLTASCFGATVHQHAEIVPILINKAPTPVLRMKARGIQRVKSVHLDMTGTTAMDAIKEITVLSGKPYKYPKNAKILARISPTSKKAVLPCDVKITAEGADFTVFIEIKPDADLLNLISIRLEGVEDSSGTLIRTAKTTRPIVQRLGISVMDRDEVRGARIPGIATTPKGTLLAIYDARYESSRDLQGHMDIGLSRSTDGGQSWEPMKAIIDMGEWGGLPEEYNGVSDPCILVDKGTGKIIVAGLWMYGVKDDEGKWIGAKGWNHQWRLGGSMPGLDPKETSQFMMVESSDDGVTWSKPRNLTKILKKPEWHLFAPAPGCGITMKNGTLVMPTQGRDKNGGSFSNISYSTDGGKTWIVSEPASSNTTECQVVERRDGSLMLNSRDNRNSGARKLSEAGRSIYVTADMGKTWSKHPSSGKALPEPVCCAGFIAHGAENLLVFSNPPNLRNKGGRSRMTMKFSLDDGETWPEQHHLLLDSGKSAYSCLTSSNRDTIGILYEGSRARICFQKIRLTDLPVSLKK